MRRAGADTKPTDSVLNYYVEHGWGGQRGSLCTIRMASIHLDPKIVSLDSTFANANACYCCLTSYRTTNECHTRRIMRYHTKTVMGTKKQLHEKSLYARP